ncbi:sensor histidine kinase [Streptomyces sp. NRRL F-2747]|uniref:sensor histidine kinase n=1 Tax=Streptomyces sp. NRRL F-2747 TaxID=1463843 RepID=UPI0004C95C62|nr:ATP-binding protein [Streptomyces sp. NRRL F-2747]
MHQDGSETAGRRAVAQWPPEEPGAAGADAVAAIYLAFDEQAQRLRSILRLGLVAVMALVAWAGTPPDQWPAQFALVGAYGVLSVAAWWMWRHRPARARRIRDASPMAIVDVAAVCLLQFLSVGSYLSLGLLAFLPFFTATHPGRKALLLSLAAIAGGGAVLSDPAFRRQLGTGQGLAILAMLALLCIVAIAVSRVQERRLASVAALTISRSVLLEDVVSAESRERRAVAESVHDGPLQTVLAARQDLGQARKAPDGGPAYVDRAYELLTDVERELRQVSVTLHPSVLEEAGLAAAVRTLAETASERGGITVDCALDRPRRTSADPMLFGAARELLGNVVRHARATHVRVGLRDTGTAVILEVQDDGVGVDPDLLADRLAEGHIGMASQRARIEALGGRMELLPVERGTWVRVTVPVDRDRNQEPESAEALPGGEAT